MALFCVSFSFRAFFMDFPMRKFILFIRSICGIINSYFLSSLKVYEQFFLFRLFHPVRFLRFWHSENTKRWVNSWNKRNSIDGTLTVSIYHVSQIFNTAFFYRSRTFLCSSFTWNSDNFVMCLWLHMKLICNKYRYAHKLILCSACALCNVAAL